MTEREEREMSWLFDCFLIQFQSKVSLEATVHGSNEQERLHTEPLPSLYSPCCSGAEAGDCSCCLTVMFFCLFSSERLRHGPGGHECPLSWSLRNLEASKCVCTRGQGKSQDRVLSHMWLFSGKEVVIFAAHVRALIHLRNTDGVLSKLNMVAWWMEQAELNSELWLHPLELTRKPCEAHSGQMYQPDTGKQYHEG